MTTRPAHAPVGRRPGHMRLLMLFAISWAAAFGTAAGAEETFEVERFDGTRVVGRLVSSDGKVVRLRKGDVEGRDEDEPQGGIAEWPVAEVVTIRRLRPAPVPPARDLVEIANADRLVVRPLSADEDVLRVQWGWSSEPLELPLEVVRSLNWRLPRQRRARESALSRWRRPRGEGDQVLSRNGDIVRGEFRGLDTNAVTLAVSGRPTAIPIAGIRGLGLDPELITPPETPDRHVLVQLSNGSRLTAGRVTWTTESLEVETVYDVAVRVPLKALRSLRYVGGRAIDLSDREPDGFAHTPWLGSKWGWERDRAVTGSPLRIGDRGFDKGLGVHSRSELVYDLAPGDRRFRATVGIDASAGRGGSAVFVVLVDDREVARTKTVRGGDAAVGIGPIDLGDGKRLVLRVEFADRGDVLDRANWCDLLLERD